MWVATASVWGSVDPSVYRHSIMTMAGWLMREEGLMVVVPNDEKDLVLNHWTDPRLRPMLQLAFSSVFSWTVYSLPPDPSPRDVRATVHRKT